MPGVQLIYDNTCVNTSNVTCTWTVPTGVCKVTFEIWGGGGGGGVMGTNCNCCQKGSPGSGGGYSKATITTIPGENYSIVAGAAGVSSQGYGAYCGICCNGCAGGTTYVTGTNLTNFCASGGQGGLSDFNTNCYYYCACNWHSRTPGCGYGGDTVSRASFGHQNFYGSQNPYNGTMWAGAAAGPGGGEGGVNMANGFCNGWACAVIGDSPLHGRVPGGGGAGSSCWNQCVCTPYASGRGAPGMVKITY